MNYKRANIFAGWFAFLVAAIVYLLTIPPTTSFWDCGEFIATAYKLEVCHSPGSPLFMIIARFFTLFSIEPANAAMMVNAMSGIASAFTIMFLFWTITHLAQKIFIKQGELTDGHYWSILGAGFVGAFAYMFTDTFWFSAVEGEVYALSSLFTAVVFWAILKWENVADQPYANRWIILIAYLIGLSIGVHLLNLLAIPAIVFVYYFKRYKTTKVGVLAAALISVVILGTIMYGIIPYTVKIAAFFDRVFVNSFGLPFKSGVLVFSILLIAAVIYGIWYTHKKGKVVLNTLILGVTVIIIGYSSYAMTVIRSNANPPMDQNNPEDLFSLLSYLNREQYGDRPLMYGQYYSAPVVDSEDKITYRKSGDKYEKYSNGITYIYDDRFNTVLPRMYSSDGDHVNAYKQWGDIEGKPIRVAEDDVRTKPTFGENMKFFVNYQIGFMYFRYFMWNFVGRQNDIQGHGEPGNGNWISGFNFIDKRLGDPEDLPDHLANHNARNTYYFLPFLLGLIGLFYHYSRQKKDFWVVMMLFILTGLAIVVYLNQTPYQPRERDYAYPGSFYAFAIWIGIGVLALVELFNKITNQKTAAVAATVITMVAVPGVLGSENWDDHDRSKRHTARDFAYNYLNSCEENAVLFTNGDNDTFPLWYLQEVEEERTDVRIICLPYLSTDWYIDQMKRKAYESEPVPFSMDNEKYKTGIRDYLIIRNRSDLFLNERYEIFKSEFEGQYEELMNKLLATLDRSNFVQMEESTYKKLANKGEISPMQAASLVKRLKEDNLRTKYKIDRKSINDVDKLVDRLLSDLGKKPMPLKQAMDFVASDNMNTKGTGFDGKARNYLPGKAFVIPVDKQKVIANGTVQPEDTADIVDHIIFNVKGRMVVKSDMMILDLLANNNWERPIYFSSIGRGTFESLSKFAQNEGFAYRLVPIENKSSYLGRINSRLLYDKFYNKFMYTNLNNEDNHLGWTNRRTIGVVGMRRNMVNLAEQLVAEGQKEKAIAAMDKSLEILSLERHPLDYLELGMLDVYYNAGVVEKGNELVKKVFNHTLDELDYYLKDDPIIDMGYGQSQQIAVAVMHTIFRTLQAHKQTAMITELKPMVKEMLKTKSGVVEKIEQYSDRDRQLMNIFFSIPDSRVQDWFKSLSDSDRQFITRLNELGRQEIKILQLYVSWIKE